MASERQWMTNRRLGTHLLPRVGRLANRPCRRATATLLVLVCFACAGRPSHADGFDLRRVPLERIPPGTVIGETPPPGWTHLLIVSKPRLGRGDVEAAKSVAPYISLLKLCILANVSRKDAANGPEWQLDKIAIGYATDIRSKNTVISSDTQRTLGANLGFVQRQILTENEKLLGDVTYVLRGPNLAVFDSKAILMSGDRHKEMLMRHAVVVSPKDGGLGTLVWLLDENGNGNLVTVERTMQMLPPNLHEDRLMNVDGRRFVLGIPKPDAFAMTGIPQGTPLPISAELAPLAAERQYSAESAARLESELWATLKRR